MQIGLRKTDTQLVVTPIAPPTVGFGHFVGRAWVAGDFELGGEEMRVVVADEFLDLRNSTSRITVLAFVVDATAKIIP